MVEVLEQCEALEACNRITHHSNPSYPVPCEHRAMLARPCQIEPARSKRARLRRDRDQVRKEAPIQWPTVVAGGARHHGGPRLEEEEQQEQEHEHPQRTTTPRDGAAEDK